MNENELELFINAVLNNTLDDNIDIEVNHNGLCIHGKNTIGLKMNIPEHLQDEVLSIIVNPYPEEGGKFYILYKNKYSHYTDTIPEVVNIPNIIKRDNTKDIFGILCTIEENKRIIHDDIGEIEETEVIYRDINTKEIIKHISVYDSYNGRYHKTHIKPKCNKCNVEIDSGWEPDKCLGELPNILFACCGHGEIFGRYFVFDNDITIRHFKYEDALKIYEYFKSKGLNTQEDWEELLK